MFLIFSLLLFYILEEANRLAGDYKFKWQKAEQDISTLQANVSCIFVFNVVLSYIHNFFVYEHIWMYVCTHVCFLNAETSQTRCNIRREKKSGYRKNVELLYRFSINVIRLLKREYSI